MLIFRRRLRRSSKSISEWKWSIINRELITKQEKELKSTIFEEEKEDLLENLQNQKLVYFSWIGDRVGMREDQSITGDP